MDESFLGGGELGGAASGAMTGTVAGSVLGPWGAVAGIAIGAIGGLISAAGASAQGRAQAAMFNYRAGIAAMNSKIALQNADYERNVGEVEAQASGMKTRAQVGATTAAQARSGLDVNRGSAVNVRESETEIGQQNEAIIRSNATRKAFGYEVESAQDIAQANLYGMASTASKTGGNISALTSLLSAGTTVAEKWSKASEKGALP